MKHYLFVLLALCGCASTPKYTSGDCLDYSLVGAKRDGTPSEFREILTEFKIKGYSHGNYTVSIVNNAVSETSNKKESSNLYLLSAKEVDSSVNICECPK
jgi:hypothetical protein